MRPEPARAPLWYFPAGILIGLAGALCGIGGGLFAGPLLFWTRGLALKRASATALLVVLATTASSTLAEFWRADSQIVGAVAWPLALGALLGSELGFRAHARIEELALRRLFALVLLVAGARVFFFSGALGGGADAGPGLTVALALLYGLVGGFLVPLLGIGSGVVMVPLLFLTLGGLGFPGARACSLAAGAVSGLRSVQLHARARNIEFALGWPLALGALLGAQLGVVAAHDPELVHAGRVLLGTVLVLQALRLLDGWKRED
jgi:hypothetical protein